MGLFDRFKSQRDILKEEIVEVPWKRLTDMEQLDAIEAASKEEPVVIFKHSTRCGISAMVLRQFESAYDLPEDSMQLYFLDLLQHRDISNEVASRFGVTHQSPQVLVIKNGAVVHHDSHHSISAAHLKKYT